MAWDRLGKGRAGHLPSLGGRRSPRAAPRACSIVWFRDGTHPVVLGGTCASWSEDRTSLVLRLYISNLYL